MFVVRSSTNLRTCYLQDDASTRPLRANRHFGSNSGLRVLVQICRTSRYSDHPPRKHPMREENFARQPRVMKALLLMVAILTFARFRCKPKSVILQNARKSMGDLAPSVRGPRAPGCTCLIAAWPAFALALPQLPRALLGAGHGPIRSPRTSHSGRHQRATTDGSDSNHPIATFEIGQLRRQDASGWFMHELRE